MSRSLGSVQLRPPTLTQQLYVAIIDGDCDKLPGIIEAIKSAGNGANIINGIGEDVTPIKYCVIHNRIECLRILIDAGADVNVVPNDQNHYTALLTAVGQQNRERLEIIRMLIEAGANVNYQSYYGTTALHISIGMQHSVIANYLIDNGADVNILDHSGSTLLMIAVRENMFDIADRIIDGIRDINKQNNNGFTALYYACKTNNVELVRKLIERGADVNLSPPNKPGIGQPTPLHMACNTGNFEIIKLLLLNGADIKPIYVNFTALDKLKLNHKAVYDKLQQFNILMMSQAIFDTHGAHLDPESMENIYQFAGGAGKSRRNKKRNKKSQRRKSSRRRRQRKN